LDHEARREDEWCNEGDKIEMQSNLIESRPTTRRMRVRVRGSVQGVGFRPFVYGLAQRYDLAGFVANDSDGVLIEVEGSSLSQFLTALNTEAPPLARVDAIETEPAHIRGEDAFAIACSVDGRVTTCIAPDAATCEACLDELFDRGSRFHRYPFVNCTHCGPRYAITRNLPYDRPRTSMATFAMCGVCARDRCTRATRADRCAQKLGRIPSRMRCAK
jgi:hydrogenase maturation protein HypF